jgi:hypothetical protein
MDLELSGDWNNFFDLLGHRLERVFLHGEPGSGGNASYFGETLVTESCGKFQYDRTLNFGTAIRAFFSAANVKSLVDIELMKVPEVIQAKNKLYLLSLPSQVSPKTTGLSGAIGFPENKEKAEADFFSAKDRLWPKAAAKIYKELLSVLVDFFRVMLTRLDGTTGFRMVRADVQRFFVNCSIQYDVTEDGNVIRFKPEPIAQVLRNSIFQTGDKELDALLTTARAKFFDRDSAAHRESIEKLWDAWERLKTIEPGRDKKAQVEALFSRLSVGNEYRNMLKEEASLLTNLGNRFMIRHSETNKIPIESEEEINYLFNRLFTLIWIFLRETNRVS